MSETRKTKLCKYCAEDIYFEAKICIYCGKKQENNVELSSSFMFVVWIPTMSMLLSSFFFGSWFPAIIGIIYWTYMYSKYD
jgi:hypothetical protein